MGFTATVAASKSTFIRESCWQSLQYHTWGQSKKERKDPKSITEVNQCFPRWWAQLLGPFFPIRVNRHRHAHTLSCYTPLCSHSMATSSVSRFTHGLAHLYIQVSWSLVGWTTRYTGAKLEKCEDKVLNAELKKDLVNSLYQGLSQPCWQLPSNSLSRVRLRYTCVDHP